VQISARQRTKPHLNALRWPQPPEHVLSQVYLLSPAASYITGSCIRIDGGAPNARRGWWDLQPAKNNVGFDGFHRSAIPAILDEVP
jgi:citronellol/citronellal dehydrogenase